MADLYDDDKFPQDMMEQLKRSQTLRTVDAAQWSMSLAFLEGRQYLLWDNKANTFVQSEQALQGRNKATINLTMQFYRSLVAHLSVNYPSIAITPTSPDYEALLSQQASEQALKWYWGTERMEYVFNHMIKWLVSCGNGALHTYYDPDQKKIRTESVAPFDLFFEPYCLSPDESNWIGIRHIYDKKALAASFPEFSEQIKKSPPPSNRDIYNARNAQYPEHRVEVMDVYWRDGRHGACLADGTWLYRERTPDNVFPVQFVRFTDIPMRLWGLGVVYLLLDLQCQYNKGRNTIFNNSDLMVNPAWLLPNTCDLNPNRFTNKPGLVLPFNPIGGPPIRVGAPELPAYFQNSLSQIASEMMDLAGMHSTTLGKLAHGITAGVAIEGIAKQDTGQLQLTQSNLEQAACDLATVVLTYMKHYYTEAQQIQMFDTTTGRTVYRELKGTDVIDHPHITLEAGSLFRNEAEDRDQKTMEMLKAGLITPEEAKQRLSYRLGNAAAIKKMTSYSHAKDMLGAVKMGLKVAIRSTEDLSAFEEVFSEFSETPEYYKLPVPVQDEIWKMLCAIGEARVTIKQGQYKLVWPLPEPPPAPPVDAQAAPGGPLPPGPLSMPPQQDPNAPVPVPPSEVTTDQGMNSTPAPPMAPVMQDVPPMKGV